jgi:hypothetical protein
MSLPEKIKPDCPAYFAEITSMTAQPEHLADRPATPADLLGPPREFAEPPALEDAALGLDAYGQPHDLLSELLRSVRLTRFRE